MAKKPNNTYRLQLLRLLERVRPDANRVEEQARSATGGEAAGGLSNAPVHLADVGTAVMDQELSAVLLENEAYLLNEMHDALARIEEGTFGRCEQCGEELDERRLSAIPYARHCVRCAEANAPTVARNVNSGRPKWETETIAADEKLIDQRISELDSDDFMNPQDVGRQRPQIEDVHAAGTPGGGSAVGGLAGTNFGRGHPNPDELAGVMGSGRFDPDEVGSNEATALSGQSGGAVGGVPAGKRSRATSRLKAKQ